MRISMMFQKPNPFPESIYENVACDLRVRGEKRRSVIDERRREGAAWRSTVRRGEASPQPTGATLPGGQQQRLCITRALATDPEIILFDKSTSALDPIATASIEQLVTELKDKVTLLIVTYNMQQAARVSDYTACMFMGEPMEFGLTDQIFMRQQRKETEDYVTGRFD